MQLVFILIFKLFDVLASDNFMSRSKSFFQHFWKKPFCLSLKDFIKVSLKGFIQGFPDDSAVRNSPAVQKTPETWVQSLGWDDLLEEGMATHSSILSWRIAELNTAEVTEQAHSKLPLTSCENLRYCLTHCLMLCLKINGTKS